MIYGGRCAHEKGETPMNRQNEWICLTLTLLLSLSISCSTREEPPQQAAGTEAGTRQIALLLPEDNAVPGWVRSDAPRFFGPGDLWEYINGAAESYLSYGFEEVVSAELTHAGMNAQAVVDIYRMEDSRNAFGIYTQELNPDSEFRRIGVEGYLGGTALNFWAGKYYVKLTVFQESEDLKGEMTKLAEQVARKLGEPGAEPPETGYFPRENLVPHSIRFMPKDVLGQSYLLNGFEARYKQGSEECKLILISLSGSDESKEALARYQQFISTSGKMLKAIAAPADGGFTGSDSFYGNMAAVRTGSRIIVALGARSHEDAVEKAAALVSSLQ